MCRDCQKDEGVISVSKNMFGDENPLRYIEPTRYETSDAEQERSAARIIDQVSYLEEQVQKTHAFLSELIERLEPILMPEETTTVASDPSIKSKPSSAISNRIDRINGEVSDLQRRLMDAYRRVQL